MKCKFLKSDGGNCNANSMKGSDFCFTHNPVTADQKKEAVTKGGLAKKPRSDERLKPIKIKDASDTLVLLEDTINRVRSEPMTPQRASCISSLVSLVFRAMETKRSEEIVTGIKGQNGYKRLLN